MYTSRCYKVPDQRILGNHQIRLSSNTYCLRCNRVTSKIPFFFIVLLSLFVLFIFFFDDLNSTAMYTYELSEVTQERPTTYLWGRKLLYPTIGHDWLFSRSVYRGLRIIRVITMIYDSMSCTPQLHHELR